MGFLTSMKMNELQLYVTTLLNLTDVMLNKEARPNVYIQCDFIYIDFTCGQR